MGKKNSPPNILTMQAGVLGLPNKRKTGLFEMVAGTKRAPKTDDAALGGVALQQSIPIGLELADLPHKLEFGVQVSGTPIRASGTLPSV